MEDKLLTQEEAAEYLNCAPKTLEGWRIDKQGPPYVKVGRLVRYQLKDLQAYIEKNRRVAK